MRKKQLNVFLTTILMVASMSVYAQDGVGYVPLTALDGMLSYGQYDQSHQEAYDKLVDANEQTRWGGWFNPALSDENSWPQNSEESANKMYIIVKTKDGEAVVPTSYFLVTGYDTGSYPDRNWASWKIYGGNFDSDEFAVREGEGWTLIDEREDEPLPAENYGTKDLNFNRADGTTAYKYYWIEIAKTVANSDIYIQMSEWGLGSYETFEQYLDRPTSVDEPVNYKFLSGSSGYAGEGAENLLDGNTATKWMYQFTNREKGQTSNGAYIVFRASRAMTPSYYTLSTANDTESHPGRWKQWQIYGMNADNDESVTRDSEGWVLLDDKANVPTGNGINELPAANYASSFFTLSETNTEEYRYFKIEVDKIVSGGYMQMSEFALGDEYTCAFENIIFADANVKSICVNNWDTNGDGELSYGEAATVTSIGEVFKRNTSITIFDELQYFKGLISIGESAFQGCSSLTSIIIPDGVTSIDIGAFYSCSNLTSISIPYGVTSIGVYSFYGCSSLSSITIPEGVASIGWGAFSGCSSLTSIILPDGITTIGDDMFIDCSSLTSIIIPNGVTSIGYSAFHFCSNLTAITIPESVTIIGDYAFSGCFNLATINMGNGIRDIGVGAFNETAWYNNQEDGIVYIGNIAYKYKGTMSENASIEVKDGTLSIGVSAFSSCENLHSIILPNSLKIIGNAAFSQCPNLTSINIPNGLTTIGDGAFEGCSSLASITIPEGVTSIGGSAFFECSSLTSITIPEGVTCIRTETFNGCSSLKSITIPESVTSILDFSFWDCSSLTSITIPEGVTSIGPAFDGCRSLKSIIVGMKSPAIQIATIAFSEHYETATLYVPAGSKAAYQDADVWKDFKNIIEYNYVVGSNNPPVEHPENLWTDANGTEWYFTTNEGNAIISSRGWDDVNSCNIPSISGTIPTNLTIPSIVYIGETSYTVTSIGFDAFHGCSSLTSVTIAKGVTSIEALAFYGCSSLKSIIIPEGITSIGNGAFRDCSNLAAITIPEGVTSIEALAFYGCSSLKSINIPDGVNSIGGGTFRDCSSLESIAIPDGVTSIGDEAFLGCSSLTSVIIPDGVNSIGRGAFWNCSSLTSISIPKNVTSIGVSMFQGCSSLTSIIIPDGMTSIGGWAFYECSSLISITIPENVSSIGAGAFDGCSSLKSVIVGMQTPIDISMNSSTFGGIYETAILYVPIGNKAAYQAADVWKDFKNILGYNNVDTSLNPHVINGEGIWTDANGTVWYFTTEGRNATILGRGNNIPSISGSIPADLTIPSTVYIGETPYLVTSIGRRAFVACAEITSIVIPESVTNIGDRAFFNCSSLTSVTIPSCVTNIDPQAFRDCKSITSIVVENENTVYCSKDNSNAIIEKSTNRLIVGCKNTVIPNSVTSIGDYAFSGCSGLTSVNIPNSVTNIGDNAFSHCSGLTSVNIPNSVTSIGNNAFSYCSGLTSVNIPNSVTSIGGSAFSCCSSLTSVNISNSVTSIGDGVFENCSVLSSVDIPNSVTSIGGGAFKDCSGLTSVNIPNSVNSIGGGAFYNCFVLSSVDIPNSVTSIGKSAFYGCSGLTSVMVRNETPVIISNFTFSNCTNATLYVPFGCKAAYEAADYWNEFKEIVEMDLDISQLNNAIYIEPFTIRVGDKVQMDICLKNAEAATAYVFDLVLPEGITVAKNDKGKDIDELSDRHDDHTRTFNYKGDNAYSLSTLSGNSEQLTGNDGPIRLVTIEASDNMVEGNYAIEIKNASYSKPDGTLVSLPDTRAVVTVEDYVLGDVNGNGGIDIGDAVSIVNYLVGKDSSIFVAKAADTNKNGQIDIGDAVTIVNLLVGKITNFTREFNIIWDEKEPE